MTQRLAALWALLVCAIVLGGCPISEPSPSERAPKETELRLDADNVLIGGAPTEKLDGVCFTDARRASLNCDVYNGLSKWNLTEVTLKVMWAPYLDGDSRVYRQRVNIPSLTTGKVSVALGKQLPPDTLLPGGEKALKHWMWGIDAVRGVPTASK